MAVDDISDSKWMELEEQCYPPFLDESILTRDVFQHYQEDTDHMTFFRQSEVIKKLSSQGVCVIVGRCADFLLSENAVKISVYANPDFCRLRKQGYYPNSTQKQMDEQIRSIKRRRKGYDQRFTGQEWGPIYDVSIHPTAALMEQ